MSETLLWISGATHGLGAALARRQPFGAARIINLDLVQSPLYETIPLDLTDPATWDRATLRFLAELTGFAGRTIFVQSAYAPIAKGLALRVDPAEYQASLIANSVAPMMLGRAFLAALGPAAEAGLLLLTSSAAGAALPGYSSYGSCKAALEQWARVMAREVEHEGLNAWVAAIRPGLVNTDTARAASRLDPDLFPLADAMKRDFDQRARDPDEAADWIWEQVRHGPSQAVISARTPATPSPASGVRTS